MYTFIRILSFKCPCFKNKVISQSMYLQSLLKCVRTQTAWNLFE